MTELGAVFNNNQYCLVFMHAPWCMSCRAMKAQVDSVLDEFPNVSLVSVDVSLDPDSAVLFQVSSLPLFIFVVDGREVERLSGGVQVSAIKSMIKRHIPVRDVLQGST
jgi:thioredoxin-like negative regulator of GroEL